MALSPDQTELRGEPPPPRRLIALSFEEAKIVRNALSDVRFEWGPFSTQEDLLYERLARFIKDT